MTVPPSPSFASSASMLAAVCASCLGPASPAAAASFPVIAVPAGVRADGIPASVQLVAAPGGENLLLALAAQIAEILPWQRHPEQAERLLSGTA